MTKPEIIAFVIGPLWTLAVCGALTAGYLWHFRPSATLRRVSPRASVVNVQDDINLLELIRRRRAMVHELDVLIATIRDPEQRTAYVHMLVDLDGQFDDGILRDGKLRKDISPVDVMQRFLAEAAKLRAAVENQLYTESRHQAEPERRSASTKGPD